MKRDSHTGASSLCIVPLSEREESIELLAGWHHAEWLKGRFNATAIEAQQNFEKRVQLLSTHCQAEPLPATFVAELHGQVVGSASLVYYQFTQAQSRTEWLTNVYVLPSQRRQGIAGKLLEHACCYAAQHGVNELKLYTQDKQNFYLQRGWKNLSTGIVQGAQVAILSRVL